MSQAKNDLQSLGDIQTASFSLAKQVINRVNLDSGSFTATLPGVQGSIDSIIHLLITSNSSNKTLTVAAASGETVDSASSIALTNTGYSSFYCDGIEWVWLEPAVADTYSLESHALGGAFHSSSTLAELNALISDATLVDSPSASFSTLAELNTLVTDATLLDLPTLGTSQTAGFTAALDTINLVDISSSSFTCTLPTAASAANQTVKILIESNSPSYELTVTGDGAETIDGVANVYLQGQACSEFHSNGTAWRWLKRGQQYIDRGDISSADFNEATLTLDNNHHDLSLTSIIPKAAYGKAIQIRAQARTTGSNPGSILMVKSNSGSGYNTLYAMQISTNRYGGDQGPVVCSATGIVDYVSGNSPNSANIFIRGWWVDI